MSDQSPTQGITCPHGSLLPELAGTRARRAAVPPVVWRHLQAAWKQACADRRAKPGKPARQKSNGQAAASPSDTAGDRWEPWQEHASDQVVLEMGALCASQAP